MSSSIIYFCVVSLPEQFLMALFTWLILGKPKIAKFYNVLVMAVSAAAVFWASQVFIPNLFGSTDRIVIQNIFVPAIQVISFLVLMLLIYRVNIVEAVVGSLVMVIVFTVAQATIAISLMLLFGWTREEFDSSQTVTVATALVYFAVMILICYFIYKFDLNIRYLMDRQKDKPYTSRVKFLVLQLSFSCMNLFIVYSLFLNNITIFETFSNKVLTILCFLVNIIFTVILVKSVFKMGEIIQKEEELKRKYDGREFIQNIDYMKTLVEEKQYEEIKKFLDSMKADIDNKIVSDND
ncbi:hypothetical protein M972_112940 [Acetivibrio thermocellus AD2]|jgi:Na+-transporting methylmalonyl-CoA/oxaloacetate decarboxylase gamma subunit|uniref:Uncharacterized protein n=1 Tax=Acetivibrio thermocellus AD2 TaxID=1138384 RepID=A0AB36TKG5_ACETH|nr:hypothetical protein [Acetivibrio thermocellus]CDG36678.1 hypothetical protein CTHBC1_2075 [Acetivibrio thermocellus BC1]ADU75799.1 hypothetical protein Clo1313_2819 [Acetivibrio thermocellus DSM 1313]ALX09831.1 hypothetical protein AD2_02853 [Acetivibrio thermocellus AD2]ANV77605.1 hypothetical protein LQRI_2864 [Acetivibrio thermocellus DSM 2360]EIC03654.1 hypothetical protein YSBL_2612 [Acetivibrio thermocellus YS]